MSAGTGTSPDSIRRTFLTFLASSPLGAGVPEWLAGFAEAADARDDLAEHALISSPGEALNVFDFEPAARQKLPPAHFGYLATVKDITKMKLVVKGLETREHAELALRHGVEGIIVSNHGGRAQESGRETIECLAEVIDGVQGKIPVLVDGGFRRGTDIFKALALGAKAVCIGRPYGWGLAAFGQPGVEKVLEILTRELELMMRHAGATSLSRLDRSFIVDGRRG
jgi:isopentenyl diphosphate isomerase/L-lactate dehydrogenase-like FMN-dependent dehydrogenase